MSAELARVRWDALPIVLIVAALEGCTLTPAGGGSDSSASGAGGSGSPDTSSSSTDGPTATVQPGPSGGTPPIVADLDLSSLRGRIAFSAGPHPDDDIYVIDANGRNLRRLTGDPASDFDPTWSPDGSAIAWRTDRVGEDEIFVMRADGSGQVNLTNRPDEDYAPAWSPDGRRIAFSSDLRSPPRFWTISPAGTHAKAIQLDIVGEYATWSPDGRRIAYMTNTIITPGVPRAGWDLYAGFVDGSGVARLTSWPSDEKAPAWSPDGTEIAFELQVTERGLPDVWVMSTIGPEVRRLTWNGGYAPAWAPDGAHLVYSTGGGLAVVTRDGTTRGNLPLGGLVEPVFADWVASP